MDYKGISNEELITELNKLKNELDSLRTGILVLEKSEKKYKSLVETISEVIYEVTTDGIIKYLSPAIENMMGYKPEELEGKSIFSLVVEDDRLLLEKNIAATKTYDISHHEYRFISKTGKICWIRKSTASINTVEKITSKIGTLTNITKSKQVEVELHKSETLYRYILNASSDAITIADLKGNIIILSHSSIKMFGLKDLSEAIGKPVFDFIDAEDHERLRGDINKMFGGEYTGALEYHGLRADGTVFEIEAKGRYMLDNEGQPFGFIFVTRDITEKKITQEQLLKSEERFRQVAEQSQTVIWEVDANGLYTFVSPVAELIWGYKPEELIGKLHFYDIHPKENRANFKELALGLFARKESFKDLVNAVLAKNGEIIFVTTNGVALINEENNLIGYRGADNNITEQKNTEEKLIQSEERYKTFFESNNSVMLLIDPNTGDIRDANLAACEYYGWTKSEICSMNISAINTLSEYEVNAEMNNALREKRKQFYFTHKLASGELRDVEVYSGPMYFDGLTFLYSIVHDVTDRKIAEEELHLNEASLNYSQEIAKMSSWELDVVTNKLVWSKNYYKLIDLEPYEIEPSTDFFIKIIHPDDVYLINKYLEIMHSDKKAVTYNLRFIMPDGKIKWMQNNIVPFFNNDELVFLKGINIDITDRIKKEQEIKDLNASLEEKVVERTLQLADINSSLIAEIEEREIAQEETRKARTEAEKANIAKSEFLSRMSHELRTPMNSILGFAQLLEMGELNAGQKKGVNHIMSSGNHLLDLINEVLDISRIEAGHLSLSVEPVKLFSIIEEMIDVLRPMAIERQINIKLIDSPDNQFFVRSDRQRLKQIMLNLLNNAIKYNQTEGSIVIKTQVMPKNSDKVVFIRISISDTGIGISKEDILKIFTPFERIGAERNAIEGTGLGLAVVKKLIEAMGGFIGVESVVGEGSTFWIELPKTESPLENNKKPDMPAIVNQNISEKRGNVLYIEDNVPNIELVEQILSSHRPAMQLITDRNGKQAVKLAIEHRPDLILLDLNLPDIHGGEVIKVLLENEKTKNIPVVIISSDANQSQIDILGNAGAKNYLTKPLEVIDFLKIIDEFTQG